MKHSRLICAVGLFLACIDPRFGQAQTTLPAGSYVFPNASYVKDTNGNYLSLQSAISKAVNGPLTGDGSNITIIPAGSTTPVLLSSLGGSAQVNLGAINAETQRAESQEQSIQNIAGAALPAASFGNTAMASIGTTFSRDLQTRFADHINFRDFGARCDGTLSGAVLDDAALNAAFLVITGKASQVTGISAASLAAITTRLGGNSAVELDFPAGRCRFEQPHTAQFALNTTLHIHGDGTSLSELQFDGGINGLSFVLPSNPTYGNESARSALWAGEGLEIDGLHFIANTGNGQKGTAISVINTPLINASNPPFQSYHDLEFTNDNGYTDLTTNWANYIYLQDPNNTNIDRIQGWDHNLSNNTVTTGIWLHSTDTAALSNANIRGGNGNINMDDVTIAGGGTAVQIDGYGFQGINVSHLFTIGVNQGLDWLSGQNSLSGSLTLDHSSMGATANMVNLVGISTVFSDDNFFYNTAPPLSTNPVFFQATGGTTIHSHADTFYGPLHNYENCANLTGAAFQTCTTSTTLTGPYQSAAIFIAGYGQGGITDPSVISDDIITHFDNGILVDGGPIFVKDNDVAPDTTVCYRDTGTETDLTNRPMFSNNHCGYKLITADGLSQTQSVDWTNDRWLDGVTELGTPGIRSAGAVIGTSGSLNFHSVPSSNNTIAGLNAHDATIVVAGGTAGVNDSGNLVVTDAFTKFNSPVLAPDFRYLGFVVPQSPNAGCNVGDSGDGVLLGQPYHFYCVANNRWTKIALNYTASAVMGLNDITKRPPNRYDDAGTLRPLGSLWGYNSHMWRLDDSTTINAGWTDVTTAQLPGDTLGLRVSAAGVATGGTGYQVGDSLYLANELQLLVTSVSTGGVITGTSVADFHWMGCAPTGPVGVFRSTNTAGNAAGTGATFNLSMLYPGMEGTRLLTKCYSGPDRVDYRQDSGTQLTVGFTPNGNVDLAVEDAFSINSPVEVTTLYDQGGSHAFDATNSFNLSPVTYGATMLGNARSIMFNYQGYNQDLFEASNRLTFSALQFQNAGASLNSQYHTVVALGSAVTAGNGAIAFEQIGTNDNAAINLTQNKYSGMAGYYTNGDLISTGDTIREDASLMIGSANGTALTEYKDGLFYNQTTTKPVATLTGGSLGQGNASASGLVDIDLAMQIPFPLTQAEMTTLSASIYQTFGITPQGQNVVSFSGTGVVDGTGSTFQQTWTKKLIASFPRGDYHFINTAQYNATLASQLTEYTNVVAPSLSKYPGRHFSFFMGGGGDLIAGTSVATLIGNYTSFVTAAHAANATAICGLSAYDGHVGGPYATNAAFTAAAKQMEDGVIASSGCDVIYDERANHPIFGSLTGPFNGPLYASDLVHKSNLGQAVESAIAETAIESAIVGW